MLENFSVHTFKNTYESLLETARKHAVYVGAAGAVLIAAVARRLLVLLLFSAKRAGSLYYSCRLPFSI